MSLRQKKEILRHTLLSRRNSMSQSEWEKASKEITKKVLALPEISNSDTIHTYLSMNERKEVDTYLLVKELLKRGKTVLVPVITDFENTRLGHVKINSLKNISVNKWGIPEPQHKQEVPIGIIDLILVPMAGGDNKKNRIGYGKGFYDSFLKNIKKNKIGLCFDYGIIDNIPVQKHDVQLDTIVTENRIIR